MVDRLILKGRACEPREEMREPLVATIYTDCVKQIIICIINYPIMN